MTVPSSLKNTNRPQSKPIVHLAYLDGLRAIAAIYVVIHHAVYQTFPHWELPKGATQIFGTLFARGHFAVVLFLVLSGFCLMLPIVRGDGKLRGSLRQFFQRRAIRILPSYFAAIGFSWLLVALLIHEKTGSHWDISLPVTTKTIVSHLFLVHDAVNESYTLNHSMWSIAVEWRIYFLFPLLVWAWRKYGAIATTVLATIAGLLLSKIFYHTIGESLTAHFLGLFGMGMLACSISLSPSDRWTKARNLPWGTIAIVLLAIVGLVGNQRLLPRDYRDLLVGGSAMAMLIWVSCNPQHWVTRMLSYKPLATIGVFSYSLYLTHAPLLQVLWQYPFRSLQSNPSLMLFALCSTLPFLIAIAYLFFWCFERPFLQWKPPLKA